MAGRVLRDSKGRFNGSTKGWRAKAAARKQTRADKRSGVVRTRRQELYSMTLQTTNRGTQIIAVRGNITKGDAAKRIIGGAVGAAAGAGLGLALGGGTAGMGAVMGGALGYSITRSANRANGIRAGRAKPIAWLDRNENQWKNFKGNPVDMNLVRASMAGPRKKPAVKTGGKATSRKKIMTSSIGG